MTKLLVVLSASWIVAQTAGSPDINIVSLLGQLGISGVFIWLYQGERKERQATQAQLVAIVERVFTGLTESTSTLEAVQAGMQTQVDQAKRPDLAKTVERLEEALSELDQRLPKDRRR